MHGKQEFAKIKSSIYNIPIEAVNICNILPRPADSNGLIVVKLKRDLKYRGYVYFEPVHPNVIPRTKVIKNISISEGLSSKEMINFSGINKHQDVAESIHKKIISNETEYGSVEDPLSMHRNGSNKKALVSKFRSIINEENIIAPEQGEKTVSISSDKFCEEQAFSYLLPKG